MGNGGNAYASNVRVIDKLYRNGTYLLLNEYEETFESIGPGSRNVFQYNFEFNETGRYYHNALLYINDELKMSSISGLTRVKDAYEEGCYIDEGNVPEEDEVCCMSGERRPLDYGNAESGRCGCPDGFGWDPLSNDGEGACKPIFTRCGWDEINEVNKCTSLVYIITHPIECLFDKPNKERTQILLKGGKPEWINKEHKQ